MKTLKNSIKTLIFFTRTAPMFCALHIFSTIIFASKVYIIAYFNKTLIEKIVQQIQSQSLDHFSSIIFSVGQIFLIEFSYSVFSHVTKYYSNKTLVLYHDKMNIAFNEHISKIDISHFDSPFLRNKTTQAQKDMGSIEALFKSTVSIIVALISIFVSIAIITRLDFLVTLMMLLSLFPSFFARKKIQKSQYELEKEQNTTNREIGYYNGLFWNRNVAPEMRLYNYSRKLLSKLTSLLEIKNKKNFQLNKKNSLLELLCLLLTGFINIGYNIYVIFLILTKGLGVGDYNYYTSIAGSFKGNIEIILNNISVCLINTQRTENYWNFMTEKSLLQEGTKPVEQMKIIQFVNVSFAYPDSSKMVLDNVSFTIHAGEKIAFAGLNGAGKTTITKLLFRMYDPSDGVILFNGEDIRNLDITEYRKMFCSMMQDSTSYQMSLRENVVISNFEAEQSEEKIVSILQSVGLTVSQEDLNTQIGKDFDSNGIILSKGQSQSLCLARLFYRDSPLCIFDEPASNLDATIEKQLFDYIFSNFSNSHTVILISHRLCNLKHMDKIVFLENGKVIEEGNHEQLYNLQGRYYRLYKIQSDRY